MPEWPAVVKANRDEAVAATDKVKAAGKCLFSGQANAFAKEANDERRGPYQVVRL